MIEEEMKRLQHDDGSGYNQVEFQYGNVKTASPDVGIQHGPLRDNGAYSPNNEDIEQAFILPKNFEVPVSLQLPDTMKQHAIIEKTARFISAQGVQMEILIKAKQSNNPQFEFLSQNSNLNPYYKFVMNAMKNGTYPAAVELQTNKCNDENSNAGGVAATSISSSSSTAAAAAAEMYASSTADAIGPSNAKPIITVPIIKYKPSANCAYTQLISKIKGVPLPAAVDASAEDATAGVGNKSGTNSPQTAATIDDIFTPVLLQYNGNTFITSTSAAATTKPILAKAAASHSNSNSLSSPPRAELLQNTSALALAQNYASDTEESENEESKKMMKSKPEPICNFPIPTDNLKNIIDKTATYVVKNGRQFEETLRTKSEERFTFLMPENEYYAYYMYKISGDPDAASKEQKTRRAAAVAAALLSKKGLMNADKNALTISFSIKTKEENGSGNAMQPALPQETSDDDEDVNNQQHQQQQQPHQQQQQQQIKKVNVPENVQKAIKLVESQLMARNAQLAAATVIGAAGIVNMPQHISTAGRVGASSSTTTATTTTRSRFDIDYFSSTMQQPIAVATAATTLPPSVIGVTAATITTVANAATIVSNSKMHAKSSKAEIERNAQYEQQQQNRQKELKKAEEKVKDKLAQIAREKLGGILTKEKQLQKERKRKAMAFLNQINGGISTPPANETTNTATGAAAATTTARRQRRLTKKSSNDDIDDVSDDTTDTSVHSIPITSFGPDEQTDDDDDDLDDDGAGRNNFAETINENQYNAAAIKSINATKMQKAKDMLKAKISCGRKLQEASAAAAQKQQSLINRPTFTTTIVVDVDNDDKNKQTICNVDDDDDDDVQLVSETKAPIRRQQQHIRAIKTKTKNKRSRSHERSATRSRRKRARKYSVELTPSEKSANNDTDADTDDDTDDDDDNDDDDSDSNASNTNSSDNTADSDNTDDEAMIAATRILHRHTRRSQKLLVKESRRRTMTPTKSKKHKRSLYRGSTSDALLPPAALSHADAAARKEAQERHKSRNQRSERRQRSSSRKSPISHNRERRERRQQRHASRRSSSMTKTELNSRYSEHYMSKSSSLQHRSSSSRRKAKKSRY